MSTICHLSAKPGERKKTLFCVTFIWIVLPQNDTFELIFFQVAQYIKFEIPVLDSFVEKLKEEEEREIIKLTKK